MSIMTSGNLTGPSVLSSYLGDRVGTAEASRAFAALRAYAPLSSPVSRDRI